MKNVWLHVLTFFSIKNIYHFSLFIVTITTVRNRFFSAMNHDRKIKKITRKSLIYNLIIFYLLLYYFKTINMAPYIP